MASGWFNGLAGCLFVVGKFIRIRGCWIVFRWHMTYNNNT